MPYHIFSLTWLRKGPSPNLDQSDSLFWRRYLGNWVGCGEQTRRLGRLGVKAIVLEHLPWDPVTDGNREANVSGRRDSCWVGEGREAERTGT